MLMRVTQRGKKQDNHLEILGGGGGGGAVPGAKQVSDGATAWSSTATAEGAKTLIGNQLVIAGRGGIFGFSAVRLK